MCARPRRSARSRCCPRARSAPAHAGSRPWPPARIPTASPARLLPRRASSLLEDDRVKVLALDYGSARTGVAVSDPTGTLARPIGVVEGAAGESGLAELARLVREEDVERIVVGLPLTLRGTRGEQVAETERFRSEEHTSELQSQSN